MKRPSHGFIKSIVEISHVEFNALNPKTHELVCTSGLGQRMLGYSADEYARMASVFMEPLIHPEDKAKISRMIERVTHARPGEIIETIARYRRADGEYISVYTRKAATEWDDSGQLIRIITIAEDVTDVVGLQQKLQKSLELLEAISAKNSHEIRGPVATILGIVGLMDEKGLMNEITREWFAHLKTAVKKLDDVIYEINTLANADLPTATKE